MSASHFAQPAAAPAAQPALIGLDWGTSSLRGWLFANDGAVLARRDGGPGILGVADGEFRTAFEAFCEPWLSGQPDLPVIASGMIGSRQGWREAAYVRAPAGFPDIATGLLALDDAAGRPWRVVPGVLAVATDGEHEVMRGEETQVLGALGAMPAGGRDGLFVLPGSHGKWVRVQAGRIAAIRTSLTGETWAALRGHTLLGRLCVDPDPADAAAIALAWQAFDLGVRQVHAQPGALLHLLFRVRTEGLFGRLRPDQLPAYLSGLLTGAEVADGLAWRATDTTPPVLVGSGEQLQRYTRALACLGVTAIVAPPDRAAAGLHAIARAAGLIGSV